MKLGARILKTGMAVVLALFVADLLHMPSPVFAGISAVFAIQPSIYRSYLTIIEQIQGNIIGAVLAILTVLAFGNHFLIVGLAAIILIMINLKLKIENTISLSVVTLIVLMETPSDDFIIFAILRFTTIMLGIFSAFLINMIFLPPKYETKLYVQLSDITSDIFKWIRISNHQAANHILLKKDIESIKDRFIKLDQIYLFYKEERTLSVKKRQAKLRKLVLYRQMMATSKKALEILKKLHHEENELINLPETTTSQLKELLEHLTGNHEHLFLRFIDKAVQVHEQEMKEYESIRQRLLLLYNDYLQEEQDCNKLTHVLQFVAELIDYTQQLERLEILINSYQSFHKDEMPVEIKETNTL